MDTNDAIDLLLGLARDAAVCRAEASPTGSYRHEVGLAHAQASAAVEVLLAHVGPAPVTTATEAHEASPSS